MAKKAVKKAAKKVVRKTTSKSVTKVTITKKPDVPKLLDIFNEIKKLMKPYGKKSLSPRIDIQGKYDLWSEKQVEAFGRKYDAMYLAGIIIQSGYVGFYYMPVYSDPTMKKQFRPEFIKLLKGKSCFHIKYMDDELKKDITNAMKLGFDAYKKSGWV